MGLLDGVGDMAEAETDDGDVALNGHSVPSLNGHVVSNDSNEPNLP
jgi:hypothetical protein